MENTKELADATDSVVFALTNYARMPSSALHEEAAGALVDLIRMVIRKEVRAGSLREGTRYWTLHDAGCAARGCRNPEHGPDLAD